MKTAVLNIKIDPKVKKEAQKVADQLGFTLSAIINASLKNLAREKTISYSILEPSPKLKKTIREARLERTKGTSYGPFDGAEKAAEFLRSLK